MKRELRNKWTAALRSGEYIQGMGRLKFVQEDGIVKHCCLGVLCEIAGIESRQEISYRSVHGFMFPNGSNETGVPDHEWMMIQGIDRKYNQLPSLNDSNNMTFPQIADWIEVNIPVED